MRDFPRHFFASSTSSRVNSSVASYAFSQSCDDQDRSGTWSNLGETFGKKPWKMKKTWEKWGKNGKHMGKPCSLQWKVRKTGKPSRIMGKLLKSLFSSLKFNVCRWRSPLFFLSLQAFQLDHASARYLLIPLPPSKPFCRLFRSKPFLCCALRDVFWTIHPIFAGLHFPCIVRHPTNNASNHHWQFQISGWINYTSLYLWITLAFMLLLS